jgi:hypothetical protein
MTELPGPIQAFIDTTNAGDVDGFLKTFAADAYLNDWGRGFTGRAGVASWNKTDNIGKQAHFELVDFQTGEGNDTERNYTVTLKVSGNGYNGTGPMEFTVRGDLISRLVIS